MDVKLNKLSYKQQKNRVLHFTLYRFYNCVHLTLLVLDWPYQSSHQFFQNIKTIPHANVLNDVLLMVTTSSLLSVCNSTLQTEVFALSHLSGVEFINTNVNLFLV